jgi:FkbM family methyltransferase
MRLSDFADWFALRRHLTHPWAFLRLRKKPPAEPFYDIALRDGGSFRIRSQAQDRHTFHRIYARDEYRLNGWPPGSMGTVVDIGAHVGIFAARVAPLARRVLCYEPAPENFELLRRNVARFPNVRAHPAAVAGRRGTVRLYLRSNPAAHSLLPPDDGSSREAVPVGAVTLEDVFREHSIERCDLLKLDCEGAEYEILRAVPRELWDRIARVAMEYHPARAEDPLGSGEALARYLDDLGYRTELRPSKHHSGKGLLFSERRDQ